MNRPHACRGIGLVELLVGTALGLGVLSLLTVVVAAGSRLLVTCGARGEAEDTAHLAIEAFAFDARRAGYDPTLAGIAPLVEARPDRIAFAADLDGDGTVDAASEESAVHVCTATGRLSRIIGRQSLPLAEGATGCAFRYLDAAGATITVPAAGLDPTARDGVAAVALDLTLLPTGLHGPTHRSVLVALRKHP